jgi:hypothetical protein
VNDSSLRQAQISLSHAQPSSGQVSIGSGFAMSGFFLEYEVFYFNNVYSSKMELADL